MFPHAYGSDSSSCLPLLHSVAVSLAAKKSPPKLTKTPTDLISYIKHKSKFYNSFDSYCNYTIHCIQR